MRQDLIRSFVAIELGTWMQSRIDEVVTTLKKSGSLPVRWVAAKNIHLTIKFLGESDLGKIKRLEAILQSYLKTVKPFGIHVGGLGTFPQTGNPRVIWMGIQAPASLVELAESVEAIASELGYEAENRRFSPHLTLGRINDFARPDKLLFLRNLIHKTRVESLGTIAVDHIILMKSLLTPGGPVYSPLANLPFSC